ncbi:MAG: TonB-dependent receptor plug domain-containing protein, partial [Gemmatimonadetes bacterium]|nr:TonB-dependent receptor plug domain-containing protein [Gemmatimonadota bacterium]
MAGSLWGRIVLAVSIVAAGSATALPARAQQTGTLTGTVTESDTRRPLAGVRVRIVNTGSVASTNAQGQYTITGVPARQVTVQAQHAGFAEQARTVTVTAGGTATLNFAVQPQAVQLAEIVATATGDRRRVEVGNAVSQVNAEELVKDRPVANMSDLLTARSPGVQVLSGSMTGTGARVRIRGTSSLSLSNDPIYIIDGVRMQSASSSSSIGVGGANPSRVSDINPEEIESIEVVKGPSAATLYGTDAANGVIVITTKRGRSGAPRVTVNSYYGVQDVPQRIEFVSGSRWSQINNMARTNAGLPADNTQFSVETDWQDAVFQTGNIQDHNF